MELKITHSSLSVANFLTVFWKSKVCTFIALRLAGGFVKNIRFAFCFCGINRFAIYSTVKNIFYKNLAFPKSCFKAGLLWLERTRRMPEFNQLLKFNVCNIFNFHNLCAFHGKYNGVKNATVQNRWYPHGLFFKIQI